MRLYVRTTASMSKCEVRCVGGALSISEKLKLL